MSDSPPGPEPEPPSDLASRSLPLRAIDDPAWFRGHNRDYGPLHFNAASGRFCAPDRIAFGTLYLGTDPRGSFIEAFAQHVATTAAGYVVSQRLIERSCLCLVRTTRPVRLVDLTTGAALRRLSANADARISTGSHAMSQRWAESFWRHPDQPDGILYPCRRAPEFVSVALFDRVRPDVVVDCTTNLPRDPHALAAILNHYECALIS